MTDTLELAVNGGLMRGFEDNKNLLAVNATFVREARTEPAYRFYSIGDRHPAMLRVPEGGVAIAVEIWAIPLTGFAKVLQSEPPGLCIGKVRLEDGSEVLGVLGESILCEQHKDKEITEYGDWRAYTGNKL
jgi:gamma-glutamylcyclotransferase (GGCT)/AIG2-like uncharacterized protein YtfP